jgi:hypothetical protein
MFPFEGLSLQKITPGDNWLIDMVLFPEQTSVSFAVKLLGVDTITTTLSLVVPPFVTSTQ